MEERSRIFWHSRLNYLESISLFFFSMNAVTECYFFEREREINESTQRRIIHFPSTFTLIESSSSPEQDELHWNGGLWESHFHLFRKSHNLHRGQSRGSSLRNVAVPGALEGLISTSVSINASVISFPYVMIIPRHGEAGARRRG